LLVVGGALVVVSDFVAVPGGEFIVLRLLCSTFNDGDGTSILLLLLLLLLIVLVLLLLLRIVVAEERLKDEKTLLLVCKLCRTNLSLALLLAQA
jgi:hypothetical protein